MTVEWKIPSRAESRSAERNKKRQKEAKKERESRMSDNATLVERLREGAEREFACKRFHLHAMWVEAAARIAELEAERDRLRGALAAENLEARIEAGERWDCQDELDKAHARIAELETENASIDTFVDEREKMLTRIAELEAALRLTETGSKIAVTRIAELEERIAHQRVWLEEAAIRSYEARITELEEGRDIEREAHMEAARSIMELEAERDTSRSYVDRVWQALGISTYEAAGGKALDELVGDMRAERDRLKAALQALYDDCADYIRTNNLYLGDGSSATENQGMVQARAALSDPSGE